MNGRQQLQRRYALIFSALVCGADDWWSARQAAHDDATVCSRARDAFTVVVEGGGVDVGISVVSEDVLLLPVRHAPDPDRAVMRDAEYPAIVG